MPEHGGNINIASLRYDRPVAEWLDLSTGINPDAWPVPILDTSAWTDLPQQDDGLIEVAQNYYGARSLLPVSGSQAAIQLLPQLRPQSIVATVEPSYNEHAYRWQQAGHQLRVINDQNIDAAINALDVLVIVNPDNPSGRVFDQQTLLDWHRKLSQKGGWLIVDEAFMDSTPEQSLAAQSHLPGLIVLRSVGKFFGLAGIRCGFVLSEMDLLHRLAEALGPWAVSGPAREVAKQALADQHWHQAMRKELVLKRKRLNDLLRQSGLTPQGETNLFQWVIHPQADYIHDRLAKEGIWIRYFDKPASLRFGYPDNEKGWNRLRQTLLMIMQDQKIESIRGLASAAY